MLHIQFKNIRNTFNQLADLLSTIEETDYSREITQVKGSSIGKHVRHCMEVLENLVGGIDTSGLSYDRRKRNPLYETSPLAARDKIFELLSELESIDENKMIELSYLLDPETGLEGKTISNLKREFLYVQDHTIHHMAIIKIYAECFLSDVSLPKEFGVAFSTLQFQKKTTHKET
ncbi:DinB family protein [Leptospira adleri]|uniref:Uncharacterized protein n=1 Tax=Leptospira adleri TaxID=2023186 RepID=A0A2M9YNU6_9LEPT|nr:DinB family protein [Leptospira adleri]PJZ53150.1 hypothetical protein CH380_12125 [Leptospira adleri]PJZ62060.1 hypothetical protein CH376_09720 [Leptospira adleri]TGM61698.1 DinB family protein [Leptospira adleri]